MTQNGRGRDKFKRYRRVLLLFSSFYKILPIRFRIKLLEIHRNTNGLIGLVIRYSLLKSVAQKCGDNVMIQPGVYLLSPDKLQIGNNVSIHPMCYIDSTGEIAIGNDVSIAHGTTIMSTTHNYGDRTIPIKDQGINHARVTIEDNVWIGAKVVVLSGVKIASGCILGAGTVITKDTNNDFIYGGVPSKQIKGRFEG
ncbi:acyltransferase [Anoxynatronum buryatiense]|uniref:Acetyltransferase (Isoleucine patch superfamily) n=1 Tax=Anoxynatronum buryatiense TaxID=489973 RepID=A0AA45WWD8_9CLOT|nr:acyltransferase [Anoxynatronum buryatiense]SMP56752.1 Acetyltransferase (isoleucine patch superfamily) [Anoxynatronum buryatiense]